MQPFRRKYPIVALAMKHSAAAARRNNNLSIFVVVLSVFLFGCFMYNEDVKSIAEFPFSRPKSQENQEEKVTQRPAPVQEQRTGSHELPGIPMTITETQLASSSTEETQEAESPKIEIPVEEEDEEEEEIETPPESCDLFTGEWVFDNITHPIYKEDECEFLTAQVTCMRNGRKDSSYQNWKWQPRDCNLPK